MQVSPTVLYGSIRGAANPQVILIASEDLQGPLRDFKTGTGGAYAPLSGGQQPAPLALLASSTTY
jgi:hypothetical protein